MSEAEQRSAVLAEARRWLGTPYHHMGRMRGVGADCATFPAEVYAAAGVVAPLMIEFYPPDWHLHRPLRPAGCEGPQAVTRMRAQHDGPLGPRDLAGTAGTGANNHERYLARVVEHAAEVASPQPGDFALWRIGRAFAHGAIVLAWPRIVHAVVGIGVIEDDGTAPTLAFGRRREGARERKFFSPWAALAPLPR